jgi:hypothetical protein
MSNDEKKCPMEDVVMLGPDLGNGMRPAIRHTSGCEVSFGTVVDVKDGQPIPEGATMMTLEARENGPGFKVVDEYRHGPAQVATPAYRQNYDRIFGGSQTVGSA